MTVDSGPPVIPDCHTDLTVGRKGEGKQKTNKKKALQFDLMVLDCCNDFEWNVQIQTGHLSLVFSSAVFPFLIRSQVGHLFETVRGSACHAGFHTSGSHCLDHTVSLLLKPPPSCIWILHHMTLKPDRAT